MKKIVALLSSSLIVFVTLGIAILVACLIALDFFGTNSTDGYVQDNMAYAEDYKKVLNQNLTTNQNGYISLERILYFYLVNGNLSFSKIYTDNLDLDLKRMKPINDVCSLLDYSRMSVCLPTELKYSSQQTEYQNKPFSKPLDFTKVTITSFFMEQRIVFGNYDVHAAWDLASPAESDVYSVCDGIVEKISFPYSQNITDTSGGGGNTIKVKCNIDDNTYHITYAHLYPNSATVSVGDSVTSGQQIAKVGTTGYSTGNHLHFQVADANGKNIDGMSLINFSDKDVEDTGSFKEPYFPITRPNFGY